jgi:hypothetical protein
MATFFVKEIHEHTLLSCTARGLKFVHDGLSVTENMYRFPIPTGYFFHPACSFVVTFRDLLSYVCLSLSLDTEEDELQSHCLTFKIMQNQVLQLRDDTSMQAMSRHEIMKILGMIGGIAISMSVMVV